MLAPPLRYLLFIVFMILGECTAPSPLFLPALFAIINQKDGERTAHPPPSSSSFSSP